MYNLLVTKPFEKSYKRLTSRDHLLEQKIQKTFKFLRSDPSYPGLNSHKVSTRDYGERWSSWVTGDIRIIWDYDDQESLVLLLLDIGGHSGKQSVYIN